jgi:hypothetical protein
MFDVSESTLRPSASIATAYSPSALTSRLKRLQVGGLAFRVVQTRVAPEVRANLAARSRVVFIPAVRVAQESGRVPSRYEIGRASLSALVGSPVSSFLVWYDIRCAAIGVVIDPRRAARLELGSRRLGRRPAFVFVEQHHEQLGCVSGPK